MKESNIQNEETSNLVSSIWRFISSNNLEDSNLSKYDSNHINDSHIPNKQYQNELEPTTCFNEEYNIISPQEPYDSECSLETHCTNELTPEPVKEDWQDQFNHSDQFGEGVVLYNENLQDIMQESEVYEESKLTDTPDIDIDSPDILSTAKNTINLEDINDHSYIYSDINENSFQNPLDDKNLNESEKDLMAYNWMERMVYFFEYPAYFLRALYDSIYHFKWKL